MGLLDTETLSGLDHATLFRMRERAKDNPELQGLLSQYEHRAFAREATADNPLMALPIALATPLYQLSKMLPQSMTGNRSRSAPSWGQVGHGLLGVGEGLFTRR